MTGTSEKDSVHSFVYLGVVMSVIIPITGLQESFGILLPVFVEHFDGTNSQVAWVGSIALLMDNITYLPITFVRRLFPVRLIFLGAAVLLVIAFLSTPYMPTLNYLYLSYSIPFGLCNGFINCLTVLTLYEVFDRYIGFAIAMRYAATSIGTMSWCYVLPILSESFGWRKTFVAMSSMSVVCILLAVVYRRPVSREKFEKLLIEDGEVDKEKDKIRGIVSDKSKTFSCLYGEIDVDEHKHTAKPEDGYRNRNSETSKENGVKENEDMGTHWDRNENKVHQENVCRNKNRREERGKNKKMEKDRKKEHDKEKDKNKNGANTLANSENGTSYGFLRNKGFLLTSLGYLLMTLTMSVPLTFIVQYSKTLGHPISKSKWLLSIRGISMLITRLAFSRVADILLRHRKVFWVTTALVTSFAISTGLCSLAQSLPLLLSYMAFLGGLEGLFWMCIPLRVTEMTSGKNMEECFSYLLLTCGIGNLTGPPLAGWLLDVTEDFRKVLYATSACALVAAFLISLDVCMTSSQHNLTAHDKTINVDGCSESTDIKQSNMAEKINVAVLPYKTNFEVAMVVRETCV